MKGARLAVVAVVLAGCASAGQPPVADTLSAAGWQVLSDAQSNRLSQITSAGVVHAAGVLGGKSQTVMMVMCSETQPSMLVLIVDGTLQRQQGDIANVILTADDGANLGLEFKYRDRLLFVEGGDAVRLVALMQDASAAIHASVDGEADIRFAADRSQRIDAVTGQCQAAWSGGARATGADPRTTGG